MTFPSLRVGNDTVLLAHRPVASQTDQCRREEGKENCCQGNTMPVKHATVLVSGVQNRAELLNKSTPNALTER